MKYYNRRTFLKTVGLGTASLALTGCQDYLMGNNKTANKSRPNVLFISIDDLNDWVNCLGGRPGVKTPNLDRLAAKGVLFTNAHCSAPACNPSRTSLMTGISPDTSGVFNNNQLWRQSAILKDAITIPEHFRNNGYKTIGGGKLFHCLSWIRTAYGIDQNDFGIWDEYFPSKQRSLPESVWPQGAQINDDGTVVWKRIADGNEGGRKPSYFFDFAPLGEDPQMADYKVIDWAVEQFSKQHDKPLFMGVGIFRPHIPWFVPKKYFDLYPLDEIELPKIQENDLDDCSPVGKRYCRRQWQRWIVANDLWKNAVQGYLASISFADAQLGRLINAFEKSRYSNNTIIVLWSDHGMHIGEKEHWEKFTLWEESTRVPLIFVAPGITKVNSTSHRPVTLLDIYPTLIDLCNLPQQSKIEGHDLMPLLKNPNAPWRYPALTTWGQGGDHAIRTERYRYILYHDGSEELYDHNTDPDEFTNIAQRPEFADIKAELKKWVPKKGV